MSDQFLWVTGPMPAMNELLEAKAGSSKSRGKHWNKYNTLKQAWSENIIRHAAHCAITPFGASYYTFYVLERDQRRDPDGFCFGAAKFVLDALVKGGFVDNDGWKHTLGFQFHWAVSGLPGVHLIISPERTYDKADAAILLGEEL